MQTTDRHSSALSVYLQHLNFYIRKHGVTKAVKIALDKFRIRTLGQWEWLYSIDLEQVEFFEQSDKQIELLPFESEEEIETSALAGLRRYKSKRACSAFLKSWFSRGATLWLSRVGNDIVGLQWTIEGGIDGFYSVPVQSREVIIVSVEVFPPYRGKGLYPQMISQLLGLLKHSGHRRAYLKVAVSNLPMQRSMAKTPWDRIGRVYTFHILHRVITIWDHR